MGMLVCIPPPPPTPFSPPSILLLFFYPGHDIRDIRLTHVYRIEILTYLLQTLASDGPDQVTALINHRNNSGNTPLHWAALNTHLDCVKALVEAGADIGIKNDAGHDAVFLAERTAWSLEEEKEGEDQVQEQQNEGEEEDKGKMSKGREVVEWLLGCEKGAGLETGVGAQDGKSNGDAGEEMEGIEKTGANGN